MSRGRIAGAFILILLIYTAFAATAHAQLPLPPLPGAPTGGGGGGEGGGTSGGGTPAGGSTSPGTPTTPGGTGTATGAPSSANVAAGPTAFVDLNSIGGQCDDSRSVGQVSAAAPWCTLSRAAAAAPSGATVYVRAGNYPYLDIAHQRSWTSFVTFEPFGTPPESVTINGVRTVDSQFVRLAGFRFTDLVNVYQNSQHVQVLNSDLTGKGIQLFNSSSDVLLQGNRLHNLTRDCNVGPPDGFGMYLSGGKGANESRDITVRDNQVANSPQDALNMGGLRNVLVEGNNFSTTAASQCGDHTDLIQIEGLANGPYTIRNNLFQDGGQFILRNATGLTLENNVMMRVDAWMQMVADPGTRVVNNTWWGGNRQCTGCGSILIRDYAPGSSWTKPPFNYTNHMNGTVIENNILHRLGNDSVPASQYSEDYNIITDTVKSKSSGVEGSHTIFGVPKLVDPAHGNLSLGPGSIGIDSANSSVAPAKDILGRARYDDPATRNSGAGSTPFVDRGAFELAPDPPRPLGVAPAAAFSRLKVKIAAALVRTGVKRGAFRVRVRCNSLCALFARGSITLSPTGRPIKLSRANTLLVGGRSRLLTLRASRSSAAAIWRAVRRHKAVLVVQLRAVGTQAQTTKIFRQRIKL